MKSVWLVSAAALAMSLMGRSALATEGLTESVWHNIPLLDGNASAEDITAEQLYADGNHPSYTFINTVDGFQYANQNFDWAAPNTIAAWFGADAAGAALMDNSPVPTGYFSFDAQGYIRVTTAGYYTFDLGNTYNGIDDAARVTVGGNIVAQQNYVAGLTPYDGQVYLEPGYTSFDLFYFQTLYGYGLTLDATGPGGSAVSYTTGVPEPATWASMMLGFAGLGFVGHRKARRRALAA